MAFQNFLKNGAPSAPEPKSTPTPGKSAPANGAAAGFLRNNAPAAAPATKSAPAPANGAAAGFLRNNAPATPVTRAAAPTGNAGADIVVDGYWGPSTTTALQRALSTTADGIISGQDAGAINAVNGGGLQASSWQIGVGGSACIRALQNKLGVTADGYFGPGTCRALQQYLGTYADGIVSAPSSMVTALQQRLNAGTF